MTSTFFFGLSKSFIFAVTTRAVAGALSGNAMVINSAVGDITDETNQVQAYVWTGLAYNIASICGPVIGYAVSSFRTFYFIYRKVDINNGS